LHPQPVHDTRDVLRNLTDPLAVGANAGSADVVDQPIEKLLAVVVYICEDISQVKATLWR
jgi:hypothetical protein